MRAQSIRHGAEDETRNVDGESFIIGTFHQVRSFHETFHRFENAKAIIAVRPARFDDWLLADHTFAFHFLHLSGLMRDEPVPPEQLHGIGAEVFDGDKVSEDELAAENARLPFQIQRPDGDFDIFGDLAEHAHGEKVRRKEAVCNKQKGRSLQHRPVKLDVRADRYLIITSLFVSVNTPAESV